MTGVAGPVAAVDPGKSAIGTGSISKTTQGQFVLVHVTVRNIGNQQQSFDQSSQKMIDQQGRQLSPDTTAGVYVDPNNFLAQINPGNSVEGWLVYGLFDFVRAVSLNSGLRRPAGCGCSGSVCGGRSSLGFGIRRRRV